MNEASLDEQVYSPLSSTCGSEIVRRFPSTTASSGMSPSTLLQKKKNLISVRDQEEEERERKKKGEAREEDSVESVNVHVGD